VEHSPSAVREQITRGGGCRVLGSSTLHDGGHAFEVGCKTHAAKVALLDRLAEADAELPDVRRLAENVTAGARSDAERAVRLHEYVKDRVSFMRERRETFTPTLRTLEIGGGDCDDSARALMALLLSLDIPARLETLPERATGAVPVHVAVQVQIGGEWLWLETTIDAEPGEHPTAAARRLGVPMREDLAGLGEAETLLDESVGWLVWPIAGAAVAALWWMA
jgi:transglutaminase-like putative cysteine protease